MVKCKNCTKAIFIPRDRFTGEPRWFCGEPNHAVTIGGEVLMDDRFGGCDFGVTKIKSPSQRQLQDRYAPAEVQHLQMYAKCMQLNYITNEKIVEDRRLTWQKQ